MFAISVILRVKVNRYLRYHALQRPYVSYFTLRVRAQAKDHRTIWKAIMSLGAPSLPTAQV
jgi:hypothetical protein